ncbi:hypothetical protein AGR7C_Cc260540 [Agrobacterium deltaense Zutra 3/1]|uniref:Uncharacterized protein n=2 Tax=Agrobacterium deltaense TaxID=1183412 RepID=A0A1S7QEU7_9HYPH|nr:hypothetical protein AGR7B_Cc10044 [Agrobacterium deltaense RV3]CUX35568.1 hypothetical protein AGR7C_Cc260540 [Agrobacterium deltaense Zutra 3/1]CVI56745.1 hypothetical protein AGR7A_Cc290502 [Agrobacterium deltaense NCPPB 1641]
MFDDQSFGVFLDAHDDLFLQIRPKSALLAVQIQLPTEGNRYGDWYSKVVQRNQGLRLHSA